MTRTSLALLICLAATTVGTAAKSDSLFEVEHARTNARVGGPVDWWGAVSGTPDWRRSYYARESASTPNRFKRYNRRLDVERD